MRAASTPERCADTRHAQLCGIVPKQRPVVIFGYDASGDAPGNKRAGEVAIRGFDMP
jgi:hypothetical protein